MIKIMQPKKQIYYTNQEKKKFLEILKNYSKVVENKHTHSAALKAKNLAWLKIASEFNSSSVTNFHRTPKQLRRLWMNFKQRQRDAVARTVHPIPSRGPVDDIISGSNVLQIAHALMTGIDSSMESDIVLENITNDDKVLSEASLCLSEESQNNSSQESPLLNTLKMEPMSPINAYPAEPEESPPIIQNRALTTNNKTHISQQENHDSKTRLQSDVELQVLEIQLLKEKMRFQKEENKSREAHAVAIHNLEHLILKEKLREAKAKADLAKLHLRRQNYSDD